MMFISKQDDKYQLIMTREELEILLEEVWHNTSGQKIYNSLLMSMDDDVYEELFGEAK